MDTGNGRERWSSRWGFILVATGAAAGLGNIWKFPYIVGENGGGAFMAVYLLAIAFVALPIFGAELLLGRLGNRNVVDSIRRVARASGHDGRWSILAWIGLLAVFVVLSFYSVVGGWTLAYLAMTFADGFVSAAAADTESTARRFTAVTGNPGSAIAWQTAFIVLTAIVVASGVQRGIERLCRWLMPLLLMLLLLLAVHGAVATDEFGRTLRFLFEPQFERLTPGGALAAVGHAFFTMSVGVGAMLTFGSYLPADVGLGRAGVTVAVLDTAVAILAGLAIFPILFASGLEPGVGPGMVFVTLPIAFDGMPYGRMVALSFFALLAVAALTSAPSMLEPMVDFARERAACGRKAATAAVVAAVWSLGVAQALSFSNWSELGLLGQNLFELSDALASNILLPLGGILIALFVGWMLPSSHTSGELGIRSPWVHRLWRLALRFIAPLAVAAVMLNGLLR